MTEAFKFDSTLENCAVKISKLMIDTDEILFMHVDKTMRNELTFNTNISSRFRQKRRRKNRNDERASI